MSFTLPSVSFPECWSFFNTIKTCMPAFIFARFVPSTLHLPVRIILTSLLSRIKIFTAGAEGAEKVSSLFGGEPAAASAKRGERPPNKNPLPRQNTHSLQFRRPWRYLKIDSQRVNIYDPIPRFAGLDHTNIPSALSASLR